MLMLFICQYLAISERLYLISTHKPIQFKEKILIIPYLINRPILLIKVGTALIFKT